MTKGHRRVLTENHLLSSHCRRKHLQTICLIANGCFTDHVFQRISQHFLVIKLLKYTQFLEKHLVHNLIVTFSYLALAMWIAFWGGTFGGRTPLNRSFSYISCTCSEAAFTKFFFLSLSIDLFIPYFYPVVFAYFYFLNFSSGDPYIISSSFRMSLSANYSNVGKLGSGKSETGAT